ncbi:hypothetical protein QC763_0101250 [Podospora pseudopauciseta]|uniref:Uncharacterized protein n=1 Tax=Podospora pseudopauciseta TaxID=2093780 RepID=A0ABR0H744_9PEZI|nr:hypothetical protein QC763_0101250 [Podospora pseudopauciseta]
MSVCAAHRKATPRKHASGGTVWAGNPAQTVGSCRRVLTETSLQLFGSWVGQVESGLGLESLCWLKLGRV